MFLILDHKSWTKSLFSIFSNITINLLPALIAGALLLLLGLPLLALLFQVSIVDDVDGVVDDSDDGVGDGGDDVCDDDAPSLLCPPRSSLSIFQWLLTSEKFPWNPISEKLNIFLEFDFWTFEHSPWNLSFLLLQPAADTSATGYGPPAEEYGAPSSSYGSAYSRSVRILCPMISSTLEINYLYFITCSKLYLASSYLIFVIFFTQAKFLENKIYTEKRQFFALNL